MDNNKVYPNDMILFDAHCDTANVYLDESSYFISKDNHHLAMDNIKKGGLNAQIFALYVNPVYSPYRAIKKALLLYNALEKKLFSTGEAVKVTSTTEMDRAVKQNQLACWLSLEGGHIIENSVDILEFFYTLGIRCMTLTHTKNTDWADSSGDKPEHDGLNKLGRRIINKMDELKMAIDVSHTSDKTVEDVLDTTNMPIMASHSCSRSICDIPRNIPDTLIKEIASRNGYIGVNFFPGFLKKNIYNQFMTNIEKNSGWLEKQIQNRGEDPDAINKAEMQLYPKLVKGNDQVNLDVLIDHISHVIDVGGLDCVGLGSDFDGIPSTPTDLSDASCYSNLVNGLMDRGFTENEIRKIMGLNLYDFLKNFDKK